MAQLETARLILRPWREQDADALFSHAQDPAVGPVAGWPTHTSVDESRQIIRDVLAVDESYAIIIKRHALLDRPVGSIGLMMGDTSNIGLPPREGEIGYWIGHRWWGHGYMTEAASELMRHAFCDLHLDAVWCGYDEGNDRSRRVQEKMGMKPHHVLHDRVRPRMGDVKTEYLTRLTRDEWEVARSADPTDAATIAAQQAEKDDIEAHLELVSAIRSGGQTGADRAGLDAARASGVPICGWCPKDGLAEDLPTPPGVMASYPELKETPSAGYVQRTAWNVRDSHATLIVAPDGLEPESGTAMTVEYARDFGRPVLVVSGPDDLDEVLRWLEGIGRGLILNVAGPRGSKAPAVYGMTKDLVCGILAASEAEGEPVTNG